MDTTELRRAGSWRFDQLAELPDDGRRYEVVDGLLVVSPPPGPRHQFVAAALIRQLNQQNPGGWHVLHELALRMGNDGRVPDIAVVSAQARCMGDEPLASEHFGLVVEVVSPSSRKTDRFAKPGSTPKPASRSTGASRRTQRSSSSPTGWSVGRTSRWSWSTGSAASRFPGGARRSTSTPSAEPADSRSTPVGDPGRSRATAPRREAGDTHR